MGNAANISHRHAQADWKIPDPGDAAALPNYRTGTIPITTGASGETNTLARPAKLGLVLKLQMVTDGGGDRVITVTGGVDVQGNTTITLANAGEVVVLEAIEDSSTTLAWRISGADSAADGLMGRLALATANNGANMIGYQDGGSFTSAADVDAALDELYQHILSAQAYIMLPFGLWREVASNDIQALAAHGGLLCKDSTPILEHTNGDTDSLWRLNWASSNSNAITCGIPLPPDLDTSADLVLHGRFQMAGATDTPTLSLDSFFNEGDTKVTDTSAALSSSVAEVTITIAAADIPSGAQGMGLELTPGAHTTDALYAFGGFWLEYTRTLLTS